MSVALFVIAALYVLNVFATIATIGKPRQPITPRLAAIVALTNLSIAAGLVIIALEV